MIKQVLYLASILIVGLIDQVHSQSPTSISGEPTYVPQNNFPWKNKYPTPLSVPQIKPEWRQLVNNATVPPAPVSVKGPDGSLLPPPPGAQDTYCHWSFSQCLRTTDIATCQKGNWAPTYDDGPSPFSVKLYDYLKQNNIKATFFVIGGQVIQYPDLLKRLHDDGHEIGIHTWSHQLLTSQTNEQIIAELKWTELAIKEVIGLSPRFMRPPYGDMDDRVREVVKQLGFIPVIWNYDTFDWKLASGTVTTTSIENTIKGWAGNASSATVGGISLEHDISQAGVDIAVNALPVLKGAYNLTLTSQCGNISHEATFKENMKNDSNNSTNSNNNKSSSDANDSLVLKTTVKLATIALLVMLIL
ncbi:uncharacterized protein BX664DRAFT_330734 [Halteromyces radiatus]|uniref:uncharacterized protein n=1 Tax=Halteromyces radiatus TaxID=101107 RepID=UPI00222001F3|nr:uncharacterized protein BX664DRAFT_330734 [Halteromyces radiatus]KAI8093849.1 hypothetical protein BX664DRAFT_330734 [Halteromyces radiatus]